MVFINPPTQVEVRVRDAYQSSSRVEFVADVGEFRTTETMLYFYSSANQLVKAYNLRCVISFDVNYSRRG